MKGFIGFLLVGMALALACCKSKETPPCVPQKPTGKIIFRNFYKKFTTPASAFYLACDTCGPEVDFLIETSNAKSIVTKIGSDPRLKKDRFFLRFTDYGVLTSYKVTTTLKNWGDCGNNDTLTTVIVRYLYIGERSIKRFQGKRFYGSFDNGLKDTIAIDSLGYNDVQRPNIFDPANYLTRFPKPSCTIFEPYGFYGAYIGSNGPMLFFNCYDGPNEHNPVFEGIGIYKDSVLELFADSSYGYSLGTVHFKGKMVR
jgi:hypothetical protein